MGHACGATAGRDGGGRTSGAARVEKLGDGGLRGERRRDALLRQATIEGGAWGYMLLWAIMIQPFFCCCQTVIMCCVVEGKGCPATDPFNVME